MPKVIPFGDRILVKRRKIGEKLGKSKIIIATDQTRDRPTDLADVVHVPDWSFTDNELIKNAEAIVASLIKKAAQGDDKALLALLRFNQYLSIKNVQVGDTVMISKYVGTDFHDNAGGGMLTLVNTEDLIGVVTNE